MPPVPRFGRWSAGLPCRRRGIDRVARGIFCRTPQPEDGCGMAERGRPRRRSPVEMTLVFIGGAAVVSLGGCGDSPARPDTVRDLYASREDCLKDWGKTPEKCEPAGKVPGSRGGGGSSSVNYFHGPSYTPSTTGSSTSSGVSGDAPRPGSHAISRVSSTGGFGASSAKHAGSSSHASGGG